MRPTRPRTVTVTLTYGQARSLQKMLVDIHRQFQLLGPPGTLGTPDAEQAASRVRGLLGRVKRAIRRAEVDAFRKVAS